MKKRNLFLILMSLEILWIPLSSAQAARQHTAQYRISVTLPATVTLYTAEEEHLSSPPETDIVLNDVRTEEILRAGQRIVLQTATVK